MGSSFVEMADLLDKINSTIFIFVGVFVIVLSYFIVLGTPVMSYVYSLKNTKEEANRNNDGNHLFVHIKAGLTTMAVTTIISIIFLFVFVDVLHIGKTSGEVIKKVLLLETVKPAKSIINSSNTSQVYK
jgi:hypothetical protein